MDLLTIIGVAVALAMDAFAVSLTAGICAEKVTPLMTIRMSGVFGGFQFAMPVAGWLLGLSARRYIEAYDHWLAFGLLVFIGGHMLKEAWENRNKKENAEACVIRDYASWKTLLVLGVATSLDALAVGLSMAVLKVNVMLPSIVIGLVCFAFTAAGLRLGCVIRNLPKLGSLGDKASAFGGFVLILIGIKILYEHGVFHVTFL